MLSAKISDRLKLTSEWRALAVLLVIHCFISLFWLSQGGFYAVKDTSFYLALTTRAAQLPFLADCHDTFKPSVHILQNGPYYAYLLNLLQKLPGGFAPYHFVLTQVLHFAFVASFFFLARLFERSIKASFLVALLVLLEPMHQWDVLVIKPSFCTQVTIGISICLAAIGWRKRRLDFFAYSAAVLGAGYVFRTFNILFVPVILVMALMGGKNWKWRCANALVFIAVMGMATIPKTLFFRANPHLKPLSGFGQFGIVVSHRMQAYGYMKPWILPKTLEYYHSLAPRLSDPNLVKRYQGTSLPFFHAFLHERIYRYGDTLSKALELYYEGGWIALREYPEGYLKSCVKIFLINCGLPARNPADPSPFRFELRLWRPVLKGQAFRPIPKWGSVLLRQDACSAPFEQCMDMPPPKLISRELLRSLQNMPAPGYVSYLIGRTWEWVFPFKGMLVFVILAISLARLTIRREWAVLYLAIGMVGTYLGAKVFRALPTTAEIVMVLPWVLWTAGMAFTRGGSDAKEFPDSGQDAEKETGDIAVSVQPAEHA